VDSRYGLSGRLRARIEARIEGRAIREGWIKPEVGERFATRIPKRNLLERTSNRDDASMADLLCVSAIRGMESSDGRVAAASLRNAIAMEIRNQHDDFEMMKARLREVEL